MIVAPTSGQRRLSVHQFIKEVKVASDVAAGLAMDLADMCEEIGRIEEVSPIKASSGDGIASKATFLVQFKESIKTYRVQVSEVKPRKKK